MINTEEADMGKILEIKKMINEIENSVDRLSRLGIRGKLVNSNTNTTKENSVQRDKKANRKEQ